MCAASRQSPDAACSATKFCRRQQAAAKAHVDNQQKVVKVVGSADDVTVPAGLTVKAHAFTASAREKIEGAGGKCVLLSKTTNEVIEA